MQMLSQPQSEQEREREFGALKLISLHDSIFIFFSFSHLLLKSCKASIRHHYTENNNLLLNIIIKNYDNPKDT